MEKLKNDEVYLFSLLYVNINKEKIWDWKIDNF